MLSHVLQNSAAVEEGEDAFGIVARGSRQQDREDELRARISQRTGRRNEDFEGRGRRAQRRNEQRQDAVSRIELFNPVYAFG
jgi:hypothetical protein